MARQYRHRRSSNAFNVFPTPLEPGELAVNTANRQLAVGDAATPSLGVPVPLIAIRYFDVRARYLINDNVVHVGTIYRAITSVQPGPFNIAQWTPIGAGGASGGIPEAPLDGVSYERKDATWVPGGGGSGGGIGDAPFDGVAYARQDGAWVPEVQGGGVAADIPVTPAGQLSATNVQAALQELDNEKVAKAGDTMTGPLFIDNSGWIGVGGPQGDLGIWSFQGVPGPPENGRWGLSMGQDATFSQFNVQRYDDIGTLLDYPISISRADGKVTLAGDPTAALHAATKQYVDSHTGSDPTKVAKAGDTMTGNLSISPTPGTNLKWGAAGVGGSLSNDSNGSPSVNFFCVSGTGLTFTGGAVTGSIIQGDAQGGVSFLKVPASVTNTAATTVAVLENTGRLLLGADPASPMHAATKQYVDSHAGSDPTKVLKTGDTMTGPLNFNGSSHWVFSGAGAGSFYDSIAGADRFFIGTDNAQDVLRLYAASAGNVLTVDGTTGVLAFPTGATTPTPPTAADTRVANTAYVEARAEAWGVAAANTRLPLVGGTMTGPIQTSVAWCDGSIAAATAATGGITVNGDATTNRAAYIAFHRQGSFAAYLGLDIDNVWKVGGWSMGNVAYKLWHDGNADAYRDWTNTQGYAESVSTYVNSGTTFINPNVVTAGQGGPNTVMTIAGGSTTIQLSAYGKPGHVLTVRIKQDATTPRQVAWLTNQFLWAGGPTNVPIITPKINAVDRFTFVANNLGNFEEVGRAQDIG